MAEKEKNDKVKEPNRLQRWWRETVGELRKVSWPTPQEAWRMTRIVLIVMATTSAALGLLDFLFSKIIEAIIIAA